jgi:hypothetical protein
MSDEIPFAPAMQTFKVGDSYPIVVGEIQQDAVDEAHEAAVLAKLRAEKTREFVLERVEQLRGKIMPVEILSVQNLPGHACLIVNDHLLLSYDEAEQLINQMAEQFT